MGIDGGEIKNRLTGGNHKKSGRATSKLLLIAIFACFLILLVVTTQGAVKGFFTAQKNQQENAEATQTPMVQLTKEKDPLILYDKNPDEIKRECFSYWQGDESAAKECTKKNLDILTRNIENEIIQREYELRAELYKMVDDYEKNCRNSYKYGSTEHSSCMKEAAEERKRLDLEY